MSKIVVKKKVFLDFLGEDYKEAYIELQSIPMRDYDALLKNATALQDDNSKSLDFIRSEVENRFVSGKFPVDGVLVDIAKEDLLDLPGEAFVEAFQQLTGQASPKG